MKRIGIILGGGILLILVYVAYSDRVIEGSPKNSISTVPIMGWPVT
jgi:catabolite regulation protein CreA